MTVYVWVVSTTSGWAAVVLRMLYMEARFGDDS